MPTQAEIDAVLAAWYCHECYGKHFISGMKHGVTSETDAEVTRTATITTTIGNNVITLLSRDYEKTSHFKFEFFDPHGVAPNGPIDTQYVSYWSGLAGGQNCWGDKIPGEYDGSYDVSSSWENSLIYYADLRDDTLVYYHESGGHEGDATGNTVMGIGMAYASFDGSPTPSCKGVNTLDAIKMPISLTKPTTRKELITLGDYTPYQDTTTATSDFNIAASDRSGYSGGVAYGTYAWGSYARVDQTKPYNCIEGVYEEEASPEALEDYYNSWDSCGSYTNIDEYDRSIWDANFNKIGVDHIEDGTHDYPSFINIDPLPHGSFATDAEGNYFHSMITKDMKIFNKLNDEDPNITSGLQGAGIVYYPIAPV